MRWADTRPLVVFDGARKMRRSLMGPVGEDEYVSIKVEGHWPAGEPWPLLGQNVLVRLPDYWMSEHPEFIAQVEAFDGHWVMLQADFPL